MPDIQIIHQRDPDSGCDLTVYVDGVRHSDVTVENIDPGRGYEWADWVENVLHARQQAAEHPGNQYYADCVTELEEAASSKYVDDKPEDWQRRLDTPEYDGDDDAYEKARPVKVWGESWRSEPIAHCKTREEADQLVASLPRLVRGTYRIEGES